MALSSVFFGTSASARNTPNAPYKSYTSYIDFDQDGAIYAWDGVSANPTFDFESEDIEVVVTQSVGSLVNINSINIDLPNGFVVTGFDADDTYIDTYGDTVCDTSNWSLSMSSDDVTAKGLTCYAPDGTVEFRFDVDDVNGFVTTTAVGSYSIQSQFRTVETRKVKSNAWVVETSNLLTLSSAS